MPTPFLALNITGTPQVKRCVGGQVTNVAGSAASGSAETTGGVASLPFQRVIRFLGRNTFIQLIHQKIQRSTDAGATWSDVVSDADLSSAAGKAGPHLCFINGVPTLVVLANLSGASGEWNIWTSTDGTSWTKTGPLTSTTASSYPLQSVVYWRGAFYATRNTSSSARTVTWDPINLTVSTIAFASPSTGNKAEHALCVYQDRLFCLLAGSSQRRQLQEFVGGTWVTVGDVASATGNLANDAKFALFVDPATDTMIAIFHAGSPQQWFVIKIDAALNTTDITDDVAINSVLPTSPLSAAQYRISSMVDVPENPGGSPGVLLFAAANGTAGTPFTVLRWNGVSSPITAIGQGGDVAHAMPFGVQSGGSVFWTNGQRHVERVSATPVTGGVQWGIKLYSPNGSPDNVDVCFYVGGKDAETPGPSKATLSNPSTGSISNGNTWTGLDAADNGSTTFTVTWEAEDDGYSVGDWVKSVPEVSPT